MAVHRAQRPRHSGIPDGDRGRSEKATKMAAELSALPSLSHAELKHQWEETFGNVPPKGLSRRLMVHALAYELQAQHMGQLKPSVGQELRRIAAPQPSRSSTTPLRLTPGSRLMREWRGTVHVVDVAEDGLVWNGQTYGSLSAIARTITGTRWSGQRFFGLRKRSDAAGSPQAAQSANPNEADSRPSESEKVEKATQSDPRSRVVLEPIS